MALTCRPSSSTLCSLRHTGHTQDLQQIHGPARPRASAESPGPSPQNEDDTQNIDDPEKGSQQSGGCVHVQLQVDGPKAHTGFSNEGQSGLQGCNARGTIFSSLTGV